MQRIREWMAAHPDEAANVRATNRSYIFFRITGLTNESEAVGAQGVPLTPGRSIAVDRLHEYGTPFFIEANLPVESAKSASPFRRLMIAQDTGSAIIGPARADLYWGAGDDAGRVVTVSSSVFFSEEMRIAGKMRRYHPELITALKSAACLTARSPE